MFELELNLNDEKTFEEILFNDFEVFLENLNEQIIAVYVNNE